MIELCYLVTLILFILDQDELELETEQFRETESFFLKKTLICKYVQAARFTKPGISFLMMHLL